ncbi:MAG: hypothetical protein DHS20C16_15560 [Phycisphaerae bacterium]|nr:MAG: hypothetical protein DHS20C16_15560 [Phycisphaerae bacterium]
MQCPDCGSQNLSMLVETALCLDCQFIWLWQQMVCPHCGADAQHIMVANPKQNLVVCGCCGEPY